MKKESKDLFRKVLNLLAIDSTKERTKEECCKARMNEQTERKVYETAKNLPESTTLLRSAVLCIIPHHFNNPWLSFFLSPLFYFFFSFTCFVECLLLYVNTCNPMITSSFYVIFIILIVLLALYIHCTDTLGYSNVIDIIVLGWVICWVVDSSFWCLLNTSYICPFEL